MNFSSGTVSNVCLDSTDAACFYDIQQNLAAQLSSYRWTLRQGVTDGLLSGTWTPKTTAATISAENPTLLYISTHGGVVGSQAQLCLRDCDGTTFGTSFSFGPPTLPSAWHGPNWLVLDACGVVKQGVGWEQLFGGSLHGILGWRDQTFGFDASDAAQATFTYLVSGFSTAKDAWQRATAVTNDSTLAAALIPSANVADSIELSGGPNFGPDGSVNPQYYAINSDGQLAVQSVATLPSLPQSIYSLVPEQMNESYWNTYYGGSSVPSETLHPSANENVYRNPNVSVDHYLASGGVIVSAASTGTARGISLTQAYQYALDWIQSNGGLPGDAALTFAGEQTITPTTTEPTTDQPYPGNAEYVFIWRHAQSGLLTNDKIQINVDDAGALTTTTTTVMIYTPRCQCYKPDTIVQHVPPWIPSYHINTYVRLWRSLGAAGAAYAASVSLSATSFAYCGSAMSSTTSRAVPCGVASSSGRMQYLDPQSGAIETSSEPLK
jgi:hypothetical protein